MWSGEAMERALARQDIAAREGLHPGQVVLHSGNGGRMNGATLLATLQRLLLGSLTPSGMSRPVLHRNGGGTIVPTRSTGRARHDGFNAGSGICFSPRPVG
jgi:hypothetical protein